MCSLYFVSTNVNKYEEIRAILKQHDISVKFLKRQLREIQANSLGKIAAEKSKAAFNMISKPVLVEDDGLFIHGLKGFPGPYSSFVFKSIGNNGILKLLSGSRNREACFLSVVVYSSGTELKRFFGKTEGKISLRPSGRGWGYDPIFIPIDSDLTFGESKGLKKRSSHRAKAISSFVNWYLDTNSG